MASSWDTFCCSWVLVHGVHMSIAVMLKSNASGNVFSQLPPLLRSNFSQMYLPKLETKKALLPDYAQIIAQLNRIRSQNKDVKYANIMRTTNDPLTLKFVTDADTLDLNAKKDLNLDGK